MSRIQPLTNDQASEATRSLFDQVQGKLGKVPNMMRALGHAPSALSSYLQFSGALGDGTLSARHRELIALAVGEANACSYCVAAHSAIGKMAGLSEEQIADARRGTSVDSRDEALLRFATQVVRTRGYVSDEELADVRSHGFDDAAVVEIVANVALNLFTNYFNHVAETEVDFPSVPDLEPTSSAAS